jgi:8-oxo-dGTP pyrophosphatase MutT (NUDIX family)
LTAQDGKQNWLFKAMRAFSTRNQLVQVAALAWRLRDGEVQVCLVTSRSTGRWILPKGWPEKDLSHAEAAAREAWEEAGLKGKAGPEPCGEYEALKGVGEDLTVPVRLKVFLLAEPTQSKDFPEKGQRKVKWLSLDKAVARADEDGLCKLIRSLDKAGAFKP